VAAYACGGRTEEGGLHFNAIDEYRIAADMAPPLNAAFIDAEIAEIFRETGAEPSARENYTKARQIYQKALRTDSYRTEAHMANFARFVAADPSRSADAEFGTSVISRWASFGRRPGTQPKPRQTLSETA
jgi:hypothetical protein